jgi:peptidoglycan/LPS O-acetylase OafA/YrhL
MSSRTLRARALVPKRSPLTAPEAITVKDGLIRGMPAILRSATDLLAPDMMLSHVLNFSRAIAALLVLFFHIRSTLVVPYDELDVHNWLARAFFLITTFGHDAVIIFFVLSGYLVGGAVLRLDMRSSRDLVDYAVDRCIRVGPVLIAATALSVTLQQLSPSFACHDTPGTILGNALGFQNFLVTPLCNNLPLWSISNEVVYYFTFPAMVAAFSCVFSVWLAISLGCVALIFALSLKLAPLDDTSIVFDFPFWLIGAALWLVPARFPRRRWLALLMLAAALLFGRFDFGKEHFWFRDLLLAMSFAYVLVTFFNQPVPQSGFRAMLARPAVNWSRRFADFSFSLYVTHYPLIRLYISVLNANHHESRHTAITFQLLLEFVSLSAFCILLASGFSALLERPRKVFKRVLVGRLPVSSSPGPDRTGQ